MRKVSKKRASQNRTYKIIYNFWKEYHTKCERCGKHVEYGVPPHHKKKPRVKYLCDTETWMCACPMCHDYVEKHRAESYEKGWLIK